MVVSCYTAFLYDHLATNKSGNSTPVTIIVVPVALHLPFSVHFAGQKTNKKKTTTTELRS